MSILIVILSINFISSAHYITGIVGNASDGTNANDYVITVWNTETGLSVNTTDIIGVNGYSGTSNFYLVDCDLVGCGLGTNISARVFDNGSNYASNLTTVLVSDGGFDVTPYSQLYSTNSPASANITSPSNNSAFNVSDTFFINATLSCTGVAGTSCGYVNAYLKYNGTNVNVTENAIPMFITKRKLNLTNLADAFIEETSPGTNYGSFQSLYAGIDSGGEARSWLKFNINSLPFWALVRNATLNLYKYLDGELDQNYTLYNTTNASWSESTITWNNRPTPTTECSNVNITGSGTMWISWNVTDLVDDLVTANNNLSIELRQNTSLGATAMFFRSKESTSNNHPYLETEFESPNPIETTTEMLVGDTLELSWLVNATQKGFYSFYIFVNSSSNVTGGNSSTIYVTLGDIVYPKINIKYPTNTTYSSNISILNYTIDETYPSKCWYSRNNGITNSSLVNAGTNFTGVVGIEGSNNWTVFCNDTSSNENSSIIYFKIDTIAPYFSTIPANASLFYKNQTLGVYFVANDSNSFGYFSINDTRFSINQTGYLTNATPLAVGNYEINVTINDSVGIINWTRYKVQINKSQESCFVYFNATSPVTHPAFFIAYTNCTSAYTLTQNGTSIANGTSINRGATAYNISVQRTDTANYTNTVHAQQFIISKSPEQFKVLFNATSPITFPSVFLVYANATSPFTLYRNGTATTNNSVQRNGAGYYNFTAQRTDTANYTYYFNSSFFTVSKSSENCRVLFNATSPITFPATFLAWANCTTPFTLMRNGSTISNNSVVNSGASAYNISFLRTDTQNYSIIYNESQFIVNKGIFAGTLTSTKGWSYTYDSSPTIISYIESNVGDGDVYYNVWRNDSNKSTGETVNLPAGAYAYKLNSTGGVNWSSNSSINSQTLMISRASAQTGLSFNLNSPQTYNSIIIPLCSVITGTGSSILQINDTIITSGLGLDLSASYYNFNCSLTQSENYSYAENISYFTINKNTENCQVLFNETSPLDHPKTFLVWANCSTPFTLMRNGTIVTNNSEQKLGVSAYNFSLIRTDSLNYTFYYNETEFSVIDVSSPEILIVAPTDYQSFDYKDNILFNVTERDIGIGLDMCWYSNDSGVTNYTYTCGDNFSISERADGTYNLTVWANDSLGNLGRDDVFYVVSLVAPAVTINFPTINSYLNYSENINFNVTSIDSNGLSNCSLWINSTGWHLNQTNSTPITSGVMYQFLQNISDNFYMFNFQCFDTTSISSFGGANFTFTIDTILPVLDIVDLITSVGSQTFNFNTSVNDTNLDTCKYTIFNSSGMVDGGNENVSFSCNTLTSATATSFGEFTLRVYSIDKSTNEDFDQENFTLTESSGTPPGGGGGGEQPGEEVEKIPVIGIVKTNSSTYSALDMEILYAKINSQCSVIKENRELAIYDYSGDCSLTVQDLKDISTTLAREGISIKNEDLIPLFKQYNSKQLFQGYETKQIIEKWKLFTSVLGIPNPIFINPPSWRGVVVLTSEETPKNISKTFIVNKNLAECNVLRDSGNNNLTCKIITPTTFKVTYTLMDVHFFDKILDGEVSVTTNATSQNIEVKPVPVSLKVYNINYNVFGLPFWLVGLFGLFILGCIFIISMGPKRIKFLRKIWKKRGKA